MSIVYAISNKKSEYEAVLIPVNCLCNSKRIFVPENRRPCL